MKRTHFIKRILTTTAILLMLLMPPVLHAQTGFEDDVDDETPQDPNTPIDTVLVAGLVAGTLLGYRLLRHSGQNTKHYS